MNTVGFWLAALLVLVVAAVSTVRMAWEYQRAVTFRFGRLKAVLPEGLARLGLARCLLETARPRQAVEPATAARELFGRLEARPLVAETDELLARATALSS